MNNFFFNHEIFAKTSVNVLYDTITNSNEKFKSLFDSKKILLEKHKGNTIVSNSIDYFLMNLSENNILKESKLKKTKIEKELSKKIKEVSLIASKKIKKNSDVFIHSVNNQILDLILQASKHKKFRIHLLEHQPHETGRDLIKKLDEKKIEYYLYPDLAMEHAISVSDICFIGGDAILENNNSIVKTGTNIVTDIAKKNNCPVYVCAHSWKYDNKKQANTLLNYKFGEKNPTFIYEQLSSININSYITEHGIFKPEHVVEEIKYFNKWMRI